jgi:hypothetical protein
MITEAKSTKVGTVGDIGTERIDKGKLKDLISVADSSPIERAVPVKDVMACAKSNCCHCLGRGVLTITPPGQAKAQGLVCRCAVKRFLVKNKGSVVMDKAGHFFYKE